jgi:hypothetical protein
MWTSVIAVLGTLAGAVVTGLLQRLIARADRADAQAVQARRDRMEAATALAVAVSDHRRAMWVRRHAEITGVSDERMQELRDEAHRTRSAITEPAVRLRLLFTDARVQAAAAQAAEATYRMRDAAGLDDLNTMRGTALAAHDDFVHAVGAHLA